MTTTSLITPPAGPTGADDRGGLEPADFLLATWDGGGHAAPMLSIARALRARGHQVRVLADPALRDEVASSGATFVPWRRAPHTPASGAASSVTKAEGRARTPAQQAASVRDTLVFGAAADFAWDCRDELARKRADVVVADHMLPGVLVGAKAVGVKTVSLATTFLFVPEWGVPAMGMGLTPDGLVDRAKGAILARVTDRMWRKGLPAFNAARRQNGLEPVTEPSQAISDADRVLAVVSRALEFPAFSPPSHVRIVGPRIDDPAWAEPWTQPAGDDPLILVALSSSDMDQVPVLRRIVAALSTLPVRGLVTTGPAVDPAQLPGSANVEVVRTAPHSEVLRRAAAVVTHAGHGTTAKTLAAGLPLVAMPLGRDQRDVAARVSAAGAGVTVCPKARPQRIAAAVRAVLENGRYTQAATRLQVAMAAETREDRAVAELEELARATSTPR